METSAGNLASEAGQIPLKILNELPSVARKDPYLLFGIDPPVGQESQYEKQPVISKEQTEGLNRGDILYEDEETIIISPENPLIPASEGTHLRVISRSVQAHPKTPEQWHAWLRHVHKVFGAAKVVTEGAATEDLWTNLLWEDGELATDIIGRKITGESWGATAALPDASYDHRNQRLPEEQITRLKKTIDRYFRAYWLPEMDNVNLFDGGLEPLDPHSEVFQAKNRRDPTKPYFWQNELVFAAGDHEVVAVVAAHVTSGIHLMLNIHNAPKRPWQDLTPAFESMVIAEASSQILQETALGDKPLAARAWIRATGSWLKRWGTLPQDPDVQDRFGLETAKPFKRRLRGIDTTVGQGEVLATSFHPHVLGVEFPDEKLVHRRHSIDKGEADWEGGRHMSVNKISLIRDSLHAQLPSRIGLSGGKITS